MTVGAIALAAMLIATVLFLRSTTSVLAPGPLGAIQKSSTIRPGYEVMPVSATTAYVVVISASTRRTAIYITTDAGKHWRRLSDPVPKSDWFAAARLLRDGTLMLQTWGQSGPQTPHAYLGDGVSWIEVDPPVPGGGWPRMLDSHVGFYVVGGLSASNSVRNLSIFRTLDSGAHWDSMLLLNAEHANAGGLSINEDHFVGFTDATHGWLVSAAEPYATVCGPTGWTPAGHLLASEDGGRHWSERMLSPLPNGSAQLEPPAMIRGSAGFMLATVQAYAGKCPPDRILYAYATMDSGSTWSAPRRLPVNFFSTLDGIDWWATDGTHLLRSRDQGVTWMVRAARLPARGVMLGELSPVGGENAWSVWEPSVDQAGRVALFRTTDGGGSWTEVKLPPPPA